MSDLKSDLEKYLDGTLTPAEMHLLEKRALDDPFLADALEGIGSMPAQDFSHHVNQLQKTIEARIEKKTTPLWLWYTRIAASLLLLFIVGYVVFSLVDKNISKTELALNETNEASAQPSVEKKPANEAPNLASKENVADTVSAAVDGNSKPKPADIQNARVLSSKISATETAVLAKPDNGTEGGRVNAWANNNNKISDAKQQKADTVRNNNAVPFLSSGLLGYAKATTNDKLTYNVSSQAEKSQVSIGTDNSELKTDGFYTAAMPRGFISKLNKDKKQLKVLQGKVIDDDGSPMPGVSVTLKESNVGTLTDSEGNYKLAIDSAARGELVFSFVGMQKSEIPITGSNDSINATLAPDFAELSEVVVVGYGAAEDDLAKEENVNVYQPAAPNGGRKAYKNYLIENLKYPQQAIDDKVQGKVTIQFIVEADGRLNDFRVVKGIGHGCDEEVIRLIHEGPKWIPTRRNEVPTTGKVKVKVRFSLPE